jgi:DNA-binding NarL/FixJ family response regulator
MRAPKQPVMLVRVGTRCLIVDDNPRFLRSARNLLKRQGVSVIGVASNGGEAIAIAAADRPDVALVDVDLGDEDGLDVARALASAQVPVPVILISAYAEQDLQGVLENSVALGFLPKSVVSRQAIDDLLARAGENPDSKRRSDS